MNITGASSHDAGIAGSRPHDGNYGHDESRTWHDRLAAPLTGLMRVARAALGGAGVELSYVTSEAVDQSYGTLIIGGKSFGWALYNSDRTDRAHRTLTNAILDGRTLEYKDHHIWHDKPGVRDDLVGPNVEILALVDLDTGQPAASLRMVHGCLEELPTYEKMVHENALTAQGAALLKERKAGGRHTLEVAALWKAKGYSSEATMALYRQLVHVCSRLQALCLVGAVAAERKGLVTIFGEHAIHTIGNEFPVNDGKAKDSVKLTPIILDMPACFEELLEDAQRRDGTVRGESLYMMLGYMLDGLDLNRDIPPEMRERLLKGLTYDGAAA